MRNQKVAINEKRVGRLHWFVKDGKLETLTFVDKKHLDTFAVEFKLNPANGETTALVRNSNYPALKLEKATYKDFNEAINAVNEFFNRMDELNENMPYDAIERAWKAYRNEIARAIVLKLAEGN